MLLECGDLTLHRTLDMHVQCTGVYWHVQAFEKSLNYARIRSVHMYRLMISSLFLG